MNISGILLGLLMGSALPGGTVVVWDSGGFENGMPSGSSSVGNWRILSSSQAAYGGSSGLDVVGPPTPNGDTWLFSASSAGFDNLNLDFALKVRGSLESDDELAIKWFGDGVWNDLVSYSNLPTGDWQMITLVLPEEASNRPDLTVAFSAQLSSSGDRLAFDNVILSGQPVPEPASLALLTIGGTAIIRRRPVV